MELVLTELPTAVKVVSSVELVPAVDSLMAPRRPRGRDLDACKAERQRDHCDDEP
jgi:hypothetical protein